MPYQQQISPISISIDCLNSTKYLALRDAYGSVETATPQLKQAFTRMAQDHMAMADEWFRLMHNRGWYRVPQAKPEAVSQTLSQLQNVLSQAQGIQAQAGQQQYQQPYQQQFHQHTNAPNQNL